MNQGQAALAHENPRRVLIIDDDESVLKYMSLMVQQSGFEVVVSSTIKPNLLAGFGPSDFVFVDMQIPWMDGIQVLEVLARNGGKSSSVPMSGERGTFSAGSRTRPAGTAADSMPSMANNAIVDAAIRASSVIGVVGGWRV